MKCPICGKYEFEEYGDYDIYPVCNWENDGLQYGAHYCAGGANHLRVNEARIEYFVMNHPETAEQAAKAKELYENKLIAIYGKYAGIDRTTEEEKAEQERKDFISCRQEYINRLSELMISVLNVFTK